MKLIGLLREFYIKNWGKVLTLMLVFAAAVFFLVYVTGAWMYQTNEIHELERAAGEADYSCAFSAYDSIENQAVIEKIESFDAVEHVAYWKLNGGSVDEKDTNMIWISQEMYERYPLPISDGKVRMDHSTSVIYIVDATGQYAPGDRFTLVSSDKNQSVTVEVCAVASPEARYLSFSSSSETVYAENLFTDIGLINFYMVGGDSSLIHEWLYYRNCLVYYRRDATEEGVQEVRAFLSEKGYYSTVQDITKNSWELLMPALKQAITLPVICMVIAIFAFWVMEVLFLHRKKRDYALMLLCGAKRGKLIGISTCGMVLTTLPGIFLGEWFMTHISFFQERWGSVFLEILVTKEMKIGLFAVLLIIIVLGLLTAWMGLRRTTPIEGYRRTQQ